MRRNKKLSGQFINLQIDSLPFREYHGKMEDWCFLFLWLLLPLRRCCWKWIVSSGTSTSPLIYRCRRAGGAIDGRQVSATAPACWGPRRKEEPWSEEEEEEEENLPPSAALNLFYTYGNQRIASRDSTTDIINSTHPPTSPPNSSSLFLFLSSPFLCPILPSPQYAQQRRKGFSSH